MPSVTIADGVVFKKFLTLFGIFQGRREGGVGRKLLHNFSGFAVELGMAFAEIAARFNAASPR